MLNYIRAELYKLAHRKGYWIFLAVVLALESLLVWGFHMVNVSGGRLCFEDCVLSVVPQALSFGGYFAIVAGEMVFAGQYKNGTLKNEVAFGLPRWRIYLGKLIVQLMASVLMCLVMVGYYVIICRLTTPEAGNAPVMLLLGKSLLAALPVWVGVQGMICACCFLIRGEAAHTIAAVGIYWGLPNLLTFVGILFYQYPAGRKMIEIAEWTPSRMLGYTARYLDVDFLPWLGWMCLVGGVWLAVSTALGLWRFRRKEIN